MQSNYLKIEPSITKIADLKTEISTDIYVPHNMFPKSTKFTLKATAKWEKYLHQKKFVEL